MLATAVVDRVFYMSIVKSTSAVSNATGFIRSVGRLSFLLFEVVGAVLQISERSLLDVLYMCLL